jgi:hypothetical protein
VLNVSVVYVEILNERGNRIDFNLILCPNHEIEREIITKMRNISSNHLENTLYFIGLNDAYDKNLQMDVRYCPTCLK